MSARESPTFSKPSPSSLQSQQGREIKSFRRFRRGAVHPTRNLSEIDERSLNVIENTGSRQFRFSRNP